MALWLMAGGAAQGWSPADLMASAKAAGEVLAFENEYVRVRYALLEVPASVRSSDTPLPAVLYIRVTPASGAGHTHVLEALRERRPARQPATTSRGVIIDVLQRPPAGSTLRDPEVDPPRGTLEPLRWDGGRLLVTTFEPMHAGEGTGSSPSVTTFLSDAWVEVAHRGVRRRFGVRAGDAFWFDARTRLTVLSDDPVGAAIVQIDAR
jgi:hypothetical protein